MLNLKNEKEDHQYIEQKLRKKILLVTDDIRFSSGVALVARNIVYNSSHVFNWVTIGGSRTHPEKGKIIDMSDEVNKKTNISDSSVLIYPVDGYGTPDLIRHLIKHEKPDAIFLITDPRYFEWLFGIENEIRKSIPIVYLNIWDNVISPYYNKPYYESCDALLCISKLTKFVVEDVLGDKKQNKIIDYVPHGIDTDEFYPIQMGHPEFNELEDFKSKIFKGKETDFVLFFNSRNMKRKMIPDTMLAWKYFIDGLTKEEAKNCYFILHTQPIDDAGTDLVAVKNVLFGEDYENILFSPGRLDTKAMNFLYNCSDAQILLSSNEGWGLSLTESMMVGKPIIANVTGGMQDQMRFEDEDDEWFTPCEVVPSNHTRTFHTCGEWAFPVFPTNKSIQGSPSTPYIWDDRCDPKEAAKQIRRVCIMGSDERERLGMLGREWALSEESGFTAKNMTNKVIENLNELFDFWKPREKYELLKLNDYKPQHVKHNID